MDDDKNGKEGPGLFTEHGDEEGENSDSGGSNVEEEHVRPYEHDPSFKSKEELEHFLKGCDNRIAQLLKVRNCMGICSRGPKLHAKFMVTVWGIKICALKAPVPWR